MIFGIDFGTTNSLAAVVEGEGAIALTDGDKPHPSVIWYRGSDIVVGREARNHLDRDEGGEPPGFVRSPKMKLRREGPIHVDGRTVDPREAVALVLKHLKNHAAASRAGAEGYEIDRAVMTIPIDFGGQQRRDLRVAARAAGIAVVQFVHEPAAALYAHIRSMPEDERNRKLADLDGRFVLVFDWGGGTLDITLCKIQVGVIMQVMNAGDNEIGGDQFDLRLRNLFKEKHIRRHGLANAGDLNAHEQSGMSAKLLTQCELAKIELSNEEIDSTDIYIANYMRAEGAARNLEEQVTRDELEEATGGLVVDRYDS